MSQGILQTKLRIYSCISTNMRRLFIVTARQWDLPRSENEFHPVASPDSPASNKPPGHWSATRRWHANDHPDSHIEHIEHFFFSHISKSLQPLEHCGNLPCSATDDCLGMVRQNAFKVVRNSAARDMSNSMQICIACRCNRRCNRLCINSSGLKQVRRRQYRFNSATWSLTFRPACSNTTLRTRL